MTQPAKRDCLIKIYVRIIYWSNTSHAIFTLRNRYLYLSIHRINKMKGIHKLHRVFRPWICNNNNVLKTRQSTNLTIRPSVKYYIHLLHMKLCWYSKHSVYPRDFLRLQLLRLYQHCHLIYDQSQITSIYYKLLHSPASLIHPWCPRSACSYGAPVLRKDCSIVEPTCYLKGKVRYNSSYDIFVNKTVWQKSLIFSVK